ncbi:hypothetical protein SERLADRAFT_479506 [Serpula lacrymans var. lacrymans S7.9]|uniref:Uncharacterized protein n=1 Tax=Serpula lacrymans var. lacrymans (strain S7.9) TaxID=578457 RepID=F8PBV9_SERL9|nr:uncharacterized protein SERLADRAFT_479506 [Serpula lacrymans var. lacrymans S7.9]EGO19162.1 hypothetical protein SERLADRAFT_479506 [Serpula lacrymans var. lacrymans S7.9]
MVMTKKNVPLNPLHESREWRIAGFKSDIKLYVGRGFQGVIATGESLGNSEATFLTCARSTSRDMIAIMNSNNPYKMPWVVIHFALKILGCLRYS